MACCILAFYLASAAAQSPDPDALYRQRENLASARQAAEIWAARASAGRDFEASWKLARACYWIGGHGTETERRASLDRGVRAGEQAIALDPSQPEGHFWLAANMGALAESYGVTQGIKYRGRIKDELQKVLAMNPAWLQGSPDRALGWWYHQVPGLFGGSEERAEEHLRKALTYNPNSTVTLYFLSQVVRDRGRKEESRRLLQQVLDAPLDPEWTPEDKEFKAKAAALLQNPKL